MDKPAKLLPETMSQVVKLTPDLMSTFMKCIKTTMTDTYAAHPDYPKISATHLQSFVKRFLGHWGWVNEDEKNKL